MKSLLLLAMLFAVPVWATDIDEISPMVQDQNPTWDQIRCISDFDDYADDIDPRKYFYLSVPFTREPIPMMFGFFRNIKGQLIEREFVKVVENTEDFLVVRAEFGTEFNLVINKKRPAGKRLYAGGFNGLIGSREVAQRVVCDILNPALE